MAGRNFVVEAGEHLRAKAAKFIEQVQSAVGDAVVSFYGRVGGPEAAKHEKAAIDALKSGNVADGVQSGLKIDGDILAHVVGHDHRPLETPKEPARANTARTP
jgi:hypothetical protein